MTAFQSPNYTQTPNDFFAMLPDMTDAEVRVTLVMIRQTFGFHRDGFKMGVTKLADAAGLSRQGALDGARAAEERGTFRRTNPDAQTEAEWELVVDPLQPVDTPLHSVEGNPQVGRGQVGVKERKKVIKDSSKEKATTATSVTSWMSGISLGDAHTLLIKASGMAALSDSLTGKIETVYQLIEQYGEEKAYSALCDARSHWISTPRKNGGGKYSVLNGGWVDWAVAHLAGETPWVNGHKKPEPEYYGPRPHAL